MFCKDCGKEIEDDSRFCPSCGVRQDVEVVQTEAVITGSDSRQESEENTPANHDDTSQSQSLDTGDAPNNSTEKKENVAANKKKKTLTAIIR